jgi:hypothetical protein
MRALILLCPLLLAGCGMNTAAEWRRCSFGVSDLAFQGMNGDQAEWRVVVTAFNPGNRRLKLEGLRLWALMDGDTLARLRNPNRIDLAPGDTTRMSFDVTMPHAAWNRALRSLRRTGSGDLLITGDITVSTWLGTRTVKDAVRETHRIDLASILGGGDLLRNLFFR